MRGKTLPRVTRGAPGVFPHSRRVIPSDREREVSELRGERSEPAEIGGKRGLSPTTVETHHARIRNTLRLLTAADLTRTAANGRSRAGAYMTFLFQSRSPQPLLLPSLAAA